MVPIKAIIVDDEELGRKNLSKLLTQYCPEIEIVATAASAAKAKPLIYEHHPGLVFLDINMPTVDGFEFLESFDDPEFLVVFVTAYEQHGIRAVKAGAVDYLLKPISIGELQEAVKKVLQRHKKEETAHHRSENLAIPHSKGTTIVKLKEILYLKASDNYTELFIRKQKAPLMVSRPIGQFEKTLNQKYFFRIHKSHIINLSHIKTYSNLDGGKVIMDDDRTLLVSRRRLSGFMERIREFTISLNDKK